MATPSDGLLARSLRANALFSLGFAALLVLLPYPLADWTGLESPTLLAGVGLTVLPLASVAFLLSRELHWSLTRAVIGMNLAWAAGSALLAVSEPVPWTPAGCVALLAVGAVFAGLAVLETVGLGRLQAARVR